MFQNTYQTQNLGTLFLLLDGLLDNKKHLKRENHFLLIFKNNWKVASKSSIIFNIKD
jgi:hypothetical protein